MLSEESQKLINEKRAHLSSLIPRDWRLPESILSQATPHADISAFSLLKDSNLLTDDERDITENYDATELLRLLASGSFSSVRVTTAFCKRAAIAQQLTKCITEIFFDRALERARFMDEYLIREGKTMGPFHGLPISVKDMFHVKGQFATMGYVSYLGKPAATENSSIIDLTLEAGAVLYCKTTVPQGLFIMDGFNTVFGQSMNPHKLTLTPGGSSSGEGSLVGLRGSILGIGSDIGGSIRAPALCNGTFGFKASSDRLPYSKQQELFPEGWPCITCSLGPLANSARDLTLFTRTIIQQKPWTRDSTAYAIPWRDVPQKEKLRIGVFVEDAEFPVFPPVRRIMGIAIDRLRDHGHEVILLTKFPSIVKGGMIALRSFGLDTDQTCIRLLLEGGEEPCEAFENIHGPSIQIAREKMARGKDEPKHTGDLAEVWHVNAERNRYREEWAQVWQSNKLDVLLCPGSRSTATPHGQYGAPLYTMVWNLLDFPASVIPFLNADKAIDRDMANDYNPDDVHGAPGSVQVVGWRFQDEEVLMATEIISEALAACETLHASLHKL